MLEEHRIARSRYHAVQTFPLPAKRDILVGLPDVSGAVDPRLSVVAGENSQRYLRVGCGVRGSGLLCIRSCAADVVFFCAVSPEDQVSAENRQCECRDRNYIMPRIMPRPCFRLCEDCFALELCRARRLTRENRDVSSRWNRQMDGVIFSLARVILLQSFSQAVGFYPHNRVLDCIKCVL